MPDLFRITRSTDNKDGTTTTAYSFTPLSTFLSLVGAISAFGSFCVSFANAAHSWGWWGHSFSGSFLSATKRSSSPPFRASRD
jgi:hypothetical protein